MSRPFDSTADHLRAPEAAGYLRALRNQYREATTIARAALDAAAANEKAAPWLTPELRAGLARVSFAALRLADRVYVALEADSKKPIEQLDAEVCKNLFCVVCRGAYRVPGEPTCPSCP